MTSGSLNSKLAAGRENRTKINPVTTAVKNIPTSISVVVKISP